MGFYDWCILRKFVHPGMKKKYYLKIELLPFFKVCTTTNILKLLFLKTFFHKTLQPGNDVHIIT